MPDVIPSVPVAPVSPPPARTADPAATAGLVDIAGPETGLVRGKTVEQLAAEKLEILPDYDYYADEQADQQVLAAQAGKQVPEPTPEAAPTATETPAAPAGADEIQAQIDEIARMRLQAQEQFRGRRARRADPQAELAKAVAQLADRLNAPSPQEVAPAQQEKMRLSVKDLAQQAGLSPAEVYRLLTDEMKTGKPTEVPRAPRSTQDTAIEALQAQLAEERSMREEFEARVNQASQEWTQQQRQQEQYNTHLQLSQQFQAFVQTNKAKYEFAAAADPVEVGEALAVAVANSRGPLTPDQLVSNLNNELKREAERYKHLYGHAAQEAKSAPAPEVRQPQRQHAPSTPAVPQDNPSARSPSALFQVPRELLGVPGLNSADDVARVSAAMSKLIFEPDPE